MGGQSCEHLISSMHCKDISPRSDATSLGNAPHQCSDRASSVGTPQHCCKASPCCLSHHLDPVDCLAASERLRYKCPVVLSCLAAVDCLTGCRCQVARMSLPEAEQAKPSFPQWAEQAVTATSHVAGCTSPRGMSAAGHWQAAVCCCPGPGQACQS